MRLDPTHTSRHESPMPERLPVEIEDSHQQARRHPETILAADSMVASPGVYLEEVASKSDGHLEALEATSTNEGTGIAVQFRLDGYEMLPAGCRRTPEEDHASPTAPRRSTCSSTWMPVKWDAGCN